MQSAVEEISPILEWLPRELFTSSKPTENQISSSGKALIATLNTISTQKFVYVYSTTAKDWIYCLSTNKVSCALSVTETLSFNGVAVNKSKDFGTAWIYGEWNNASKNANTAYLGGYQLKACVSVVNVYSESKQKNVLTQNIHTPTYISHMI